jgi:lipocalin
LAGALAVLTWKWKSSAGTPIVQYDTQARRRKIIAFLEPFYAGKYGCTLKGTYSVAFDPAGDKLYVTWNVSRTCRVWDCCALTVVHIPESERH